MSDQKYEAANFEWWDSEPKLSLFQAVELALGREPSFVGNDPARLAGRAASLRERIKAEVEPIDPGRTVAYLDVTGRRVEDIDPNTVMYSRDSLRQWAEAAGKRESMPAFFPEDRQEVKAMREDEDRDLLAMFGLALNIIREQGDPRLETDSGLTGRLAQEAQRLGDRSGLGSTSLANKISQALAEVEARKKG